MQNRSLEMEVFAAINQTGSFSNAAAAFSMTPSAVSKLVTRLENRLGVQLLVRSTRGLRLTAEGQRFYDASREIIQRIEAAEAEIAAASEKAAGLLRVSCNVPFGMHVITPLLPRFLEQNPGMSVDLALSDTAIDLIADKTDVAIRTGTLRDSSLRSRKLMESTRHVVASPDYLAKFGEPETPDELAIHNCVVMSGRPHLSVWSFRASDSPTELRHVDVKGKLLVNNGESARNFALAGGGIARLSEFHIGSDLRSGRLVKLLSDFDAHDQEPIAAIYSAQSHVPERIRKFLNFLIDSLT